MAAAAPVRTNWHPSKKHSDVERFVKNINSMLNPHNTCFKP